MGLRAFIFEKYKGKELLLRTVEISQDRLEMAVTTYSKQGYRALEDKLPSKLEQLAMSNNSKVIGTAITGADLKSTITILNGRGKEQRKIKCEGTVFAMALNYDGNLIAIAQTAEKDKTNLKLMDLANGEVVWSIIVALSINRMAFDPSSSIVL